MIELSDIPSRRYVLNPYSEGKGGHIVAKSKKKVEVEDAADELEDLDDLEELADESDDEEEADDEEEEDDDDEDEAPKKKSKAKKKAPKERKESDTVGTAELAEALDTDGKNLRVMLRDKKVAKNENNRYEWASIDAALKALGFDDVEEAQEALTESRNKRLEVLKERNAKTKAAKEAESASDDDDEDEDDEEEKPAPKKKSKKKKSKA